MAGLRAFDGLAGAVFAPAKRFKKPRKKAEPDYLKSNRVAVRLSDGSVPAQAKGKASFCEQKEAKKLY
jgi:hypothetical protein